MEHFFMRLAEVVVEVRCNYASTREFCKQYIVDELNSAKCQVLVTTDDIMLERQKAVKEYGDDAGQFSDSYLETLAVYRQIATQMPAQDVILMHGSVIAVDGEGYLFTAPSGTGKSTHSRLWREVFGDRAYMVNDDKPLLRVKEDGSVMVYGTPWDGKHRLSNNVGVPLKGICVLAQGKENHIRKMGITEVFPTILQQVYRPKDRTDVMRQTLDILNHLLKVGIWRLECTISKEAVRLSYEAMSGKELV